MPFIFVIVTHLFVYDVSNLVVAYSLHVCVCGSCVQFASVCAWLCVCVCVCLSDHYIIRLHAPVCDVYVCI